MPPRHPPGMMYSENQLNVPDRQTLAKNLIWTQQISEKIATTVFPVKGIGWKWREEKKDQQQLNLNAPTNVKSLQSAVAVSPLNKRNVQSQYDGILLGLKWHFIIHAQTFPKTLRKKTRVKSGENSFSTFWGNVLTCTEVMEPFLVVVILSCIVPISVARVGWYPTADGIRPSKADTYQIFWTVNTSTKHAAITSELRTKTVLIISTQNNISSSTVCDNTLKDQLYFPLLSILSQNFWEHLLCPYFLLYVKSDWLWSHSVLHSHSKKNLQ